MFHPVVTQIRTLLETEKVPYKFFEHEAVRTSEEAHALRPEYVLSQGAKALIIKCKIPNQDRKFVMCVIPGDARLAGEKVKAIVGAKSITFATKEEADAITNGVEFGGVPPFGNLFGLPVYMDETLGKNEEIIFNCGDRRASIAIAYSDYEKLVQPIRVSIIEQGQA
jgi:Ala-tRNA(Pro) deacylase